MLAISRDDHIAARHDGGNNDLFVIDELHELRRQYCDRNCTHRFAFMEAQPQRKSFLVRNFCLTAIAAVLLSIAKKLLV